MSEYSGDGEDAAESQPQGKEETPITEEGSPEGTGESLHIPTEFLQGASFKPGDEVVLKVIAAGDDGIEVEYSKNESGESDDRVSDAGAELDAIDAQHPMM